MKVVQINGVRQKGSTGKIVTDISNLMDLEAIENYIVYSGYRETKAPNSIPMGGFVNVKAHQLLGYVFGNTGFHSSFRTWKMLSLLKKMKPDVVHLHNLHGYFINIKLLLNFLKIQNIPTVWTLHDCWVLTGHCTHFDHVECDKWQANCQHCPQVKRFPYSLLLDRSKKLHQLKKALLMDFDKLQVVTVSNWLQEIVKKSYLASKSMVVIPNGVNLDVFHPQADLNKRIQYAIEDKFVILGVSNTWGIRKGLDKFIRLSSMIPNDWKIVLLGLSAEQIKGLPHSIIGIQRTKDMKELKDWYCAADVFVSLSLEETMGLVVVEAMACGTPIVVYDTTASPELVGQDCGYIVSHNNIDELLEALGKIKKNGKKKYSQNCIDHVCKNYDKEKNYRRYFDLYARISR